MLNSGCEKVDNFFKYYYNIENNIFEFKDYVKYLLVYEYVYFFKCLKVFIYNDLKNVFEVLINA